MPFGKNAHMDDIKDKIRVFLKDMEMSREVFADLCGVSKSQVDKWLSYLPIPEARQRVIERIMKEEHSRRQKSRVRMTADIHGMTIEKWASRTLIALSNVPHHNL